MPEKKDNSLGQVSSENSHKEGFLSGSYVAFVFKKIERLSSAMYLISSLWDDKEPLKWTLRERNLRVLEEASKYHYSSFSHRTNIGAVVSARIAEILSLLEIAFSSGLLSEMNLRVLREEYLYLINLIKEKEPISVSLPKNFFKDESGSDNLLNSAFQTKGYLAVVAGVGDKGHKGQIKDKEMSYIKKPSLKPGDVSSNAAISGTNSSSDRRNVILQLVKSRGEITVKDAVSVIKGYSEKTIQRELIAMASSGILKKKGERRWSKYSIA